MSEYSLRLAKPHCENCHKPKFDGHPHDSSDFYFKNPEFPPNRELKQGEIPPTFEFTILKDSQGNILHPPAELTLSERLQRLLHKPEEKEDEL